MVSFAHRVASRFFEAEYHRLLLAMSLDQAKRVLGFPPQVQPTPEEVQKAWRQLAFQHHPDRGGDPDKMVEINVAKDVLEGKGRATWTPMPRPQRERPKPPPPPEPDVVLEGQSFQEAWAQNMPPATTEWKFVSAPEFWNEGYSDPGHRIWTLYGTTDSKHVFCAVKERGESAGVYRDKDGRLVKSLERWDVSWIDAPIKQDISKVAAKNLKSVGTAWDDGAKPKGPRKFFLWTADKPTEEVIKKIRWSGGIALKDILVGIGASEEGAGRKTVVEMFFETNKEKVTKLRQEGKKVYQGDGVDVFLRINGKDAKLEDETIENLKKKVFWAIGWDKIVPGNRPINLTRMRGGRFKYDAASIIRVLADCLTSEPSWVTLALEKAAEEYGTDTKKAAYTTLRSEMTLRQAAEALGTSMYDVFQTIHY